MLSLSIIIPLYNEEERLKKTFPVLKNFIKKFKKHKIEIIFVSDGSTDKTNLMIKKFKIFKASNFKKKIIKYKVNVGKGFAVKTGVLKATNDWILLCDTDLSVHPNQFIIWFNNKLLNSKQKAYYGSREHEKSEVKASKYRVFLGFFFKKLIKYLFRIKLSDTQCGFKVFHRSYSKKIFKKISSYRFAFDVELTILLKKKKIKIEELPLKWTHKEGSKLSFMKDVPRMIIDIFLIKIRYFKKQLQK
jgi:dolichyl-phosphate beta-glucosyltransferase